MSGGTPHTVLVCMPWHEVSRPSLALGLLKASCAAHELAVPGTYYATLPWAETLLGEGLDIQDYLNISDGGFVHALGEWVFAGALNGTGFGIEEMTAYAAAHQVELGPARRMRDLADAFVDLVLRGEADESFPALMRELADDRTDLTDVPGLCWRDTEGTRRVNRPGPMVAPARLRTPIFDDWFEAYQASAVSELTEPELVLESSRGCWWGEKHHCTFCGLNGSTMTYRAKQPDEFVGELVGLTGRHRTLDVTVVDNILDVSYPRTALPALAGMDMDWRLHYEIKANITAEQASVLRAAGVWSVQPGIESLVDDVLRRMDKGVGGVRNVRALRDLDSEGITVGWNWLCGFAGERLTDYRAVIGQLPALVHLQPPGGASRIFLERFSPNFDNPALGFAERGPAARYRAVYDLSDEVLADLVYEFDTPDQGLSEKDAEPLRIALREWNERFRESSLRRREIDGTLVIRDRRAGWPHTDHVFTGAAEIEAWAQLEHGRTPAALHRNLAAAGFGWGRDELDAWLRRQLEHGLVFTEGGRWLALATTPGGIERALVRPEQAEPELLRVVAAT